MAARSSGCGLRTVGGFLPVAPQAQRLHVLEAALAAAVDHRADVVGVPEAVAGLDLERLPDLSVDARLALAGEHLAQKRDAFLEVAALQAASGAPALVALPDAAAEERRVGLHLPAVDAVVAAEGAAPRRDFVPALAAEAAAAGAAGKLGGIDPAGVGADPMSAHGPAVVSAAGPENVHHKDTKGRSGTFRSAFVSFVPLWCYFFSSAVWMVFATSSPSAW